MSTLEVDGQEYALYTLNLTTRSIIRLILQFCKENSLLNTYQMLQVLFYSNVHLIVRMSHKYLLTQWITLKISFPISLQAIGIQC